MTEEAKDPSPIGAPFLGSGEVAKKIEQLIARCKSAKVPLPHILLTGDDAEAKRRVAHTIAHKVGAKITATTGQAIGNAGDLIGTLTNLEAGGILFIEQIQRSSKIVQEFIQPAIRQFMIDFVIDKGPYARTIKFTFKQFTLIATVSDENNLDEKLEGAFLCVYRIGAYTKSDVLGMCLEELKDADIKCDEGTLQAVIEKYSSNPSKALKIFRKTLKYLQLTHGNHLTQSVVEECLRVTEHETQVDTSESRDRSIPEDVRRAVWRRDGGKCSKCGSREKLEYDHIIPVSKGGSNTGRNIELLCEACNREKSADIT